MTCQQVRESAAVSLLGSTEWDGDVAAHLAGCADCRAEVADLRRTVDLLALAGPDVVPPAEQPDPALLGRLLGEAAARRRLRLVRTALAVAAAVVLVVALGAAVGVVATRSSTPATVATGTARDDSTGVTGSVRVSAVAAGAEVAFTASGVSPGTVCTLRVVTRDGVRHPVLTWTADYTSSAQVTGTTPVPANAITGTELVDARGRLLLPVRVA